MWALAVARCAYTTVWIVEPAVTQQYVYKPDEFAGSQCKGTFVAMGLGLSLLAFVVATVLRVVHYDPRRRFDEVVA